MYFVAFLNLSKDRTIFYDNNHDITSTISIQQSFCLSRNNHLKLKFQINKKKKKEE